MKASGIIPPQRSVPLPIEQRKRTQSSATKATIQVTQSFFSLLNRSVNREKKENDHLSFIFSAGFPISWLNREYRAFLLENHLYHAFKQVGITLDRQEVPLYTPEKGYYRVLWKDLTVQQAGEYWQYYHQNELQFELTSYFHLTSDYTVNYQGIQRKPPNLIPLKKRKNVPQGKEYLITIGSTTQGKAHAFIELSDPEYTYSLGYTHDKTRKNADTQKGMIFCPDPVTLSPVHEYVPTREYPVTKETYDKAKEHIQGLITSVEKKERSFEALNNNCTTFVADFAEQVLGERPEVKVPLLDGVLECTIPTSISQCISTGLEIKDPVASKAALVAKRGIHYVTSCILGASLNMVSSYSNFGNYPWGSVFSNRCEMDSPLELARWIQKQKKD